MTDITNRLRSDDPNPSIREAAAATIDALRAELNMVSKALRKERAAAKDLHAGLIELRAFVAEGTFSRQETLDYIDRIRDSHD